jgi:peptidoglycan/LPS O-acetylase OafA/YrhL
MSCAPALMTMDKSATTLDYAPVSELSGSRHQWSTGHIRVLDGLRGLALLAVMLYHFTASELILKATGVGAKVQSALGAGWCGVDLFFVLSGFLITGILLDAKGSQNYFKSFYIRRVLRIFPLYYGVILLVFIGSRIPAVSHLFGFDKFTASLGWVCAYLSNFVVAARHNKNAFGPLNHFWSLAVEEHFYMVWPALVWLCTRRQLAITCSVFVVGALLLRCAIAFHNSVSYAPYMVTPCRVDGLALGALLALIVRSSLRVEDVRTWAWWLGGISIILVLALGFIRGQDGFNHYGRTMMTIGFSLFAIFFTSVIALAVSANPTSYARRALEFGPLMAVGRYSFAMYVLHMACLRPFRENLFPVDWMNSHFHSPNLSILLFAISASVATFVLAWLSWHVYEQNFLKLKRLFPY